VGCAADNIVVYEDRAVHVAPHETGGVPIDASHVEQASGGAPSTGAGGTTPRPAAGEGGSTEHTPAVLPPITAGAGGGGGGAGGVQAVPGGATGAGGALRIGPGVIPNLPQISCTTLTDCPTNFTCAKIDCAQPTGLCQPQPIFCDPSVLPVCGCDGVTYWNDCIRQQNGVPASVLNQCTVNAATCTTAADCKVPGASCARLSPVGGMQSCGPPGLGTCWVTPPDCTTTPAAPMWIPCQASNPGQVTRSACVNTCDAIRSEQQHVASMPGQVCR
jgi:hypothetical protein